MSNTRKKRPKRRRPKDGTYNPRSSKGYSTAGSILEIRGDKTKVNAAGEKIGISVVANTDLFEKTCTTPELAAKFSNHLSADSYRNIQEITQFSRNGSPLVVVTPEHGTELTRDADYGALIFFSNRDKVRQSARKMMQSLEDAGEIKEVPTPPQELLITKTQQKKVAKQKAGRNGRRIQSQRAVLGVSGKDHVKQFLKDLESGLVTLDADQSGRSLNLSADGLDIQSLQIILEILHKAGHAVKGDDSQNKENLFVGTAEANTAMYLAEQTLGLVMQHYPDGFNLRVGVSHIARVINKNRAELTHIGKRIEFTISAKNDFKATFVFDAFDLQKPHKAFKEFFDALIKSLIPNVVASNKSNAIATRTRSTIPKINANNFFSKSKKREELAGRDMEKDDPSINKKPRIRRKNR